MAAAVDMTALWITVALLAAPALAAPRTKGSPYFHTCRHRARAWDECVATVAQELRPLFVDGIPELGVRPIDPLCAEEIHFSEASGKFRVNLRMTNIKMEGFKDYVVTGVRSDLQELTLEVSMRVPSLTFRARYHMDGRFLFLALSGDGTCQYNLTDVDNVFLVKGHLVRRVSDDALHFRVASLRWTMSPARGSFRFSAPEGEPSLYSQATSRLLNEQAEESWSSFQDAVQHGFAEVFRERINRLMMNIPYRHLFPAGVLPLHLLEVPMDDNEADEYPPLQWTRPPTTSTTSTTTTTTTTTTPVPSTTTTTTPVPSTTTTTTPEPSTTSTTTTTPEPSTTTNTTTPQPSTSTTTSTTATWTPTISPATNTYSPTQDDSLPAQDVARVRDDGEVQDHVAVDDDATPGGVEERREDAEVKPVGTANESQDAVGQDAVDRDAVGQDAVDRDAVSPDAVDRDAVVKDAIGQDAVGHGAVGQDAIDQDAVGQDAVGPGAVVQDAVVQDAVVHHAVVDDTVGQDGAHHEGDDGSSLAASTTPLSVVDGDRAVPIASLDTAFTLLASSSAAPSTTAAPLEDVVFVDNKVQEKRTEYVIVDAELPSSATRPPEVEEEVPNDATEADNNVVPTDEVVDDDPVRSRDLRGAEEGAAAPSATEATANATESGGLSLAALGQAVGDAAKDILAEAAEALLDAWRGDATTATAATDEPTTLAP